MRRLLVLPLVFAAACGPALDGDDDLVDPFGTGQSALAPIAEDGQGPWASAKWSASRCQNNAFCVTNVSQAEAVLAESTLGTLNAESAMRLPRDPTFGNGPKPGAKKNAHAFELRDLVGANEAERVAVSMSGYLRIPAGGNNNTFTFMVGSDDGYRLRIHDGSNVQTDKFEAQRGFAYGNDDNGPFDNGWFARKTFGVRFPREGGMFPFDLVWFSTTGGAAMDFVYQQGNQTEPDRGTWTLVPKTALFGPDLRATLSAEKVGGGPVASGDQIRWTVILRNVGQTPAYPVRDYTFPGGLAFPAVAFTGCRDAAFGQPVFGAMPPGGSVVSSTADCPTTRSYVFLSNAIDPGQQVQFDYVTTVTGAPGQTVCDRSTAYASTTEQAQIGKARLVRASDDPGVSGTSESGNSRDAFEANAAADSDPTCVKIGDPLPKAVLTSPAQGSAGTAPSQLAGTARPSAAVRVDLYGPAAATASCTATANAAGQWTCAPSSLLGVGSWAADVRLRDAYGNEGPITRTTFTVAQAPSAPVLQSVPSPSTETRPTFSGTAPAGTVVTVFEGATTLCTATAAGDGSFACVSSVDLAVGPHTVRARAKDSASNLTSADSAPISFIVEAPPVDPEPPAAPTLASLPSPLAERRPTFAGVAPGGTEVTVFEGATVLCTTTASAGGSFSCVSTPALADGAHTVKARARNLATQLVSADSAPISFVVDLTSGETQPPVPPVLAALASPTTEVRPVFSGTAPAGTTVTVFEGSLVLCTAVAEPDGSFFCSSTTDLAAGTHTVQAFATDGDGRASADSQPIVFVLDLGGTGPVAPAPPELQPLDTVTAETRPTFSGNAQPGTLVTVFEDFLVLCSATASSNGFFSCAPDEDLADGPHSVQARATDVGLGLTSADSSAIEFLVDSSGDFPAAPVLTSPASHTTERRPTFAGTAEPGVRVVISEGGEALCEALADAQGAFSCQSDVELALGEHTVEATPFDADDHVGPSAFRTFVIDAIPGGPDDEIFVPVIESPAEGAEVAVLSAVEGSAEWGTAVRLFIDGIEAGTALVDEGRWRIESTEGFGLKEGEHALTAVAIDADLLESEASPELHLFVTGNPLLRGGCASSGRMPGLLALVGIAVLVLRRRRA